MGGGNLREKLTSRKIIEVIKYLILVVLLIFEIVICVQTYFRLNVINFYAAFACCFVLTVLECVNTLAVRNFIAKIVIFSFELALLLTISILTGNAFLSTLYCIVLTQCLITVDKFRDKTIVFGVSCGIFTVSVIIGSVVSNPEVDLYVLVPGILFGLLAITIDYLVTTFLLQFYRTNVELTAALKAADDSRARLEEVYEELMQTKVYEERNRIAKDIHDTAGHSMTTVIMQTEAAKLLIDDNPQEAKNRIISANVQARNALEQMRESVHLLAGRPRTQTLKEDIEDVLAQTIDGTEIKARCDLDDVTLSGDKHRFIVNSLKELLSNGIRHGKATAFYVELKKSQGGIYMLVSDNGEGVDGKIKEGFGLKGMKDKAASFGGELKISSEYSDGFEAKITLPQGGEDK